MSSLLPVHTTSFSGSWTIFLKVDIKVRMHGGFFLFFVFTFLKLFSLLPAVYKKPLWMAVPIRLLKLGLLLETIVWCKNKCSDPADQVISRCLPSVSSLMSLSCWLPSAAFLPLISTLTLCFNGIGWTKHVPAFPQQLQISWTWFENYFNQVNEVCEVKNGTYIYI